MRLLPWEEGLANIDIKGFPNKYSYLKKVGLDLVVSDFRSNTQPLRWTSDDLTRISVVMTKEVRLKALLMVER